MPIPLTHIDYSLVYQHVKTGGLYIPDHRSVHTETQEELLTYHPFDPMDPGAVRVMYSRPLPQWVDGRFHPMGIPSEHQRRVRKDHDYLPGVLNPECEMVQRLRARAEGRRPGALLPLRFSGLHVDPVRRGAKDTTIRSMGSAYRQGDYVLFYESPDLGTMEGMVFGGGCIAFVRTIAVDRTSTILLSSKQDGEDYGPPADQDKLLRALGFSSLVELRQYLLYHYSLPFMGHLITWTPDRVPMKRKPQ